MKPPVPSTDVALTRLSLFGPPPLLDGEDPVAYDELLARVSGAVKPTEALEEIWVRDVVDLAWETLRLRRIKASLFNANASRGLQELLENFMDPSEAEDLAIKWAVKDRATIKKVDKCLASYGLTMDAVMAETLLLKIDDVERIDRMIMGAEARRNSALREFERHRASFARSLRQASDEIIDAQSDLIKAPQITDRSAA